MKIKKSTFIGSLVACSLAFGALGVAASNGIQDIEAALDSNISFKVNGLSWTPKNEAGDKLNALVYDGDVYLPVSTTAEALGANVSLNVSNKVVSITNSGTSKSSSSSNNSSTGTKDSDDSSKSSSSSNPSTSGSIKMTGTDAQMIVKLQKESLTLIKMYGKALKTGSTSEFDKYIDAKVIENPEIDIFDLGKQSQKDKFKTTVKGIIAANDKKTLTKYADQLINVKSADFKVIAMNDKTKTRHSYKAIYYPQGWTGSYGVYLTFVFSPQKSGNGDFYLGDLSFS
ncbi:stalk domain-containing protein [Paenibacillus sp. FSL H8-0079]|uniref:stalk domain-containing protein n=1 Tax=Paenibacillus sp. FSL H8-0079 TaxID=2921375 RepID=UPI0030EC8BF3